MASAGMKLRKSKDGKLCCRYCGQTMRCDSMGYWSCKPCGARFDVHSELGITEISFIRGQHELSIGITTEDVMIFKCKTENDLSRDETPTDIILHMEYIPDGITPENAADKIEKWLLIG